MWSRLLYLLMALVIPGGLVLVPLYLAWRARREAKESSLSKSNFTPLHT